MVGINFLNYLDRYILPVVATKIQAEFHLDDTAIGALGTAFLLVYAVAALPFGIWADRGVRRTVVGVGVTIWSLATLLTGLARSYAQLFIARAVLGIGEAGYYPAGTSMLGDYFVKEGRSRAMSIWGAGTAGDRGWLRGRGHRRQPVRMAGRLLPDRHPGFDLRLPCLPAPGTAQGGGRGPGSAYRPTRCGIP